MYILTPALHRKLKASLTRAKNSGGPWAILKAVREARAAFDAFGYPDDWSRWRRAADDLTFMQRSDSISDDDRWKIQKAARDESDRWF